MADAEFVMGDTLTRVLLAVVKGRTTIDKVSEVTGIPRGTVADQMRVLVGLGLIAREVGTRGTARALVREVPLVAETPKPPGFEPGGWT